MEDDYIFFCIPDISEVSFSSDHSWDNNYDYDQIGNNKNKKKKKKRRKRMSKRPFVRMGLSYRTRSLQFGKEFTSAT